VAAAWRGKPLLARRRSKTPSHTCLLCADGYACAPPFYSALAIFLAAAASAAEPQRPAPLKSGIEFASADIRALQADDFANPACCGWCAAKSCGRSPRQGRQIVRSCHGDAKASMLALPRATRCSTPEPRA